MSRLSGSQMEQISGAIRSAFDRNELKRFLKFKLDIDIDDIAAPGNFQDVVFEIIDYFERRSVTEEFIIAAHQHRPNNPDFLLFAQQCKVAPLGTPDFANAELIVEKTNSFLNPLEFMKSLGENVYRVCQIRSDEEKGTGFLIGPDLILTNYHVVKSMIDGDERSEDLVITFDYLALPDGRTIDKGIEIGLHKDWLIDFSPYSEYDMISEPSGNPKPDELDYALIKLEKKVGEAPIGSNPAVGAQPRGWVRLPKKKYKFKPETPLIILQHPGGREMKIAMSHNGVLKTNSNNTRVRYKTNTEPGSSGSPCYNQDWELVAIHHSGDPNKKIFSSPKYNQGIPINTIVKLLESRGHSEKLNYE